MTELEFINTEEYFSQKRLVYFGNNRSINGCIGAFAHKKVMKYFRDKYQNTNNNEQNKTN